MKNSLKNRFTCCFKDFIRLNIAVVLILMIVRLGQYHYLSSLHALPDDALSLEWHGCLLDVVLWQFVAWAIFIPFVLLSFLKRWMGILFYGLVFLILTLSEWALFQYFSMTLRPLDQVVFSYTLKEMMMITGSCVKIDFFTFLPFIILALLTLTFFFLSLKIHLPKYLWKSLVILSIGSLLFLKWVSPREDFNNSSFRYYIALNKTNFFIEKCAGYLSDSKGSTSQLMLESAIARYHAAHPEFEFLGNRYPFLHYDRTPDHLSSFFTLGKEKPNLVFIIVESLSSCFMGNNSIYGSFTPFLDSLAGQSLYWKNFLSTADRTFNVLPAMFASLPPGDPTFVNEVAKIPFHLSMIRYLREGGYYASFFYGGDPAFNYMEDFLRRQETDFILKSFGPKYKKNTLNEGYSWGYTDTDLFGRSFEVMDSLLKTPRLDIYLTLSLHSPFIPPDQTSYLSQVEDRLRNPGPEYKSRAMEIEKYKNIFATVLYTDHAIKVFMDNYRKRPGFENTIFIITGDHALPELNLSKFSYLERYHVPMIIYSPLLKHAVCFSSVSSHLDVTPSILAMLHQQYGLKIQSVATWLGTGIDTASSPRNMHILPFIWNNKEIPEYVNHQFYYEQAGIRLIQPELMLKDTIDVEVYKRLKRELADFKILNTYITKQNKLIPPEMLFQNIIDSIEVPIKDSLFLNPMDSTGEFRSLVQQLFLDSKFHYLKFEIDFEATPFEPDKQKTPLLVLDLSQKSGKRLQWQSFEIHRNNKSREWYSVKMKEYIDLSSFNSKEGFFLHFYIWNRARVNVKFNHPRIQVTGFYSR